MPLEMKSTLPLFAALGLAVTGCKTTSSQSEATPPAAPAPAAPATPAPAKPAAATPMAADAPSKALAWGQELTSLFYKGETAPIWARMTEEMKKGLKSEESLRALKEQLDAQVGPESKVVDEKVIQSGGYQVYLRTASFPKWEKPINLIWSLDSEGRIAGFFIKPSE